MKFPAIGSGPSLDMRRVREYASAKGLVIPAPLERQLIDQNGGIPEADVELVFGRESTDVMRVFGIDMPSEACELSWIAETYAGRIPAGYLAIADDSGGNLFLLNVTSEDQAVWYWNHEDELAVPTSTGRTIDEFSRTLVDEA